MVIGGVILVLAILAEILNCRKMMQLEYPRELHEANHVVISKRQHYHSFDTFPFSGIYLRG